MTRFTRGTRVKARFQGGKTRYPGTITGVNADGTYVIDYDDGDHEDRCKLEWIEDDALGSSRQRARPRKQNQTVLEEEDLETESLDQMSNKNKHSFMAGDTVVAYFRGNKQNGQYPGQIITVHSDGTVDIQYDDGDRDTRIPAKFVTKQGAKMGNENRQKKSEPNRKYTTLIETFTSHWMKCIKRLSRGDKLVLHEDGIETTTTTCTLESFSVGRKARIKLRSGETESVHITSLALYNDKETRLVDPSNSKDFGAFLRKATKAKLVKSETLFTKTVRFFNILENVLGVEVSAQDQEILESELSKSGDGGMINLSAFIQAVESCAANVSDRNTGSETSEGESDSNYRRSQRASTDEEDFENSKLSELRNWFEKKRSSAVAILRQIAAGGSREHPLDSLEKQEVEDLYDILHEFKFPKSPKVRRIVDNSFCSGKRGMNAIVLFSYGWLSQRISLGDYKTLTQLSEKCSSRSNEKLNRLLKGLVANRSSERKSLEDIFETCDVSVTRKEMKVLDKLELDDKAEQKLVTFLLLYSISKVKTFGFLGSGVLQSEQQLSSYLSHVTRRLNSSRKSKQVSYDKFAEALLATTWDGVGPKLNAVDIAHIATQCKVEDELDDDSISLQKFRSFLSRCAGDGSGDESDASSKSDDVGSLAIDSCLDALQEEFAEMMQKSEKSMIQAVQSHMKKKSSNGLVPKATAKKKLMSLSGMDQYSSEIEFLLQGCTVGTQVDSWAFACIVSSKPVKKQVLAAIQNASLQISKFAEKSNVNQLFDTRIALPKRILKASKKLQPKRATATAVAKELQKYAGKEHELVEKLAKKLGITKQPADLYQLLCDKDRNQTWLCSKRDLVAALKKCGCTLSKSHLAAVEDHYSSEDITGRKGILYPLFAAAASGVYAVSRNTMLSQVGLSCQLTEQGGVSVVDKLEKHSKGAGDVRVSKYLDTLRKVPLGLSFESFLVLGNQFNSSLSEMEAESVDLEFFQETFAQILNFGKMRVKSVEAKHANDSVSEESEANTGESDSDSSDTSHRSSHKKKTSTANNTNTGRVSTWLSKFRRKESQNEEVNRDEASDALESEEEESDTEISAKDRVLAGSGYVPYKLKKEIQKSVSGALKQSTKAMELFNSVCRKSDSKDEQGVTSKCFGLALRKANLRFSKADQNQLVHLFKYGGELIDYHSFAAYAFDLREASEVKLVDLFRISLRRKFGIQVSSSRGLRKQLEKCTSWKHGSTSSKHFLSDVLGPIGLGKIPKNQLRMLFELMETDLRGKVEMDVCLQVVLGEEPDASKLLSKLRHCLRELGHNHYKFDRAFSRVVEEDEVVSFHGLRKLVVLMGIPMTDPELALLASNLDSSGRGEWQSIDPTGLHSFRRGRGTIKHEKAKSHSSEAARGSDSESFSENSDSSSRRGRSPRRRKGGYSSASSSSQDSRGRKARRKNRNKKHNSDSSLASSDETEDLYSDKGSDESAGSLSDEDGSGSSSDSWGEGYKNSSGEESATGESSDSASSEIKPRSNANVHGLKHLKDYLRMGFSMMDGNRSGKISGWQVLALFDASGVVVGTKELLGHLPASRRRNASPNQRKGSKDSNGEEAEEIAAMDEERISRSTMNKIAQNIVSNRPPTLSLFQKEMLFGLFSLRSDDFGMHCRANELVGMLHDGVGADGRDLWFQATRKEARNLVNLLDPKQKGFVTLDSFSRILYRIRSKKDMKRSIHGKKHISNLSSAVDSVFKLVREKILSWKFTNPSSRLKRFHEFPITMVTSSLAPVSGPNSLDFRVDHFLPGFRGGNKPTSFQVEFMLKSATGVPPLPDGFSQSDVVARKVRLRVGWMRDVLGSGDHDDAWDAEDVTRSAREAGSCFISTEHIVHAHWDASAEDVWKFGAQSTKGSAKNHQFLVHLSEQQASAKESLCIVGELCIVLRERSKSAHVTEWSCGWFAISFAQDDSRSKHHHSLDLKDGWCPSASLVEASASTSATGGTSSPLPLASGHPGSPGRFRPVDLKARRKGWRAFTKSLHGKSPNDGGASSSGTQPHLSLKVTQSVRSLSPDSKSFLQDLKCSFILPCSAVPFLERFQQLLVSNENLGSHAYGSASAACLRNFLIILSDSLLLTEFISRFHSLPKSREVDADLEDPFFRAVTSMVPLLCASNPSEELELEVGRTMKDAQAAICGASRNAEMTYKPFTVAELMLSSR